MPDPRIAVVTPYFREPLAMLEQGHRSVLAQRPGVEHVMVADGDPRAEIDGWDVRHIKLPLAHDDNGNTPRGIGSLLARNEGYDFIAYLDADNWYHDGHIASLLELWKQRSTPAVASLRTFHAEEGAELKVTDVDEDAFRHVDTSCLMIHRDGYACLPVWLDMPRQLAPICDRVFLAGLLHRRIAIASTGQRTVAFRSRYSAHYRAAGVPVPDGVKDPAATFAPARAYLTSREGVSACVQALGFWPPSYIAI